MQENQSNGKILIPWTRGQYSLSELTTSPICITIGSSVFLAIFPTFSGRPSPEIEASLAKQNYIFGILIETAIYEFHFHRKHLKF